MQSMMPLFVIAGGAFGVLMLLAFAFSGPSSEKAQARRLGSVRERHGGSSITVEAQMRKITSHRPVTQSGLGKLLPNPAELHKRLSMTGKNWTVNRYFQVCGAIMVVLAIALLAKGAPLLLALIMPVAVGLFLPNMVVNYLIKKRVKDFNSKFPEAIELMVRGLRSGLPISETLAVVSSEIPGPVGIEFKAVADRIKIGRTMDEALQEAADRLDTAEFQFFCITLAIQRETGGNLSETLSNLAEVLRKRAQMKLKIKAMSSEAKASAWIVGALPFIVFILVYVMNPEYLSGFFVEPRLMIAGIGGLVWLGTGVAIMAKMVNFEI